MIILQILLVFYSQRYNGLGVFFLFLWFQIQVTIFQKNGVVVGQIFPQVKTSAKIVSLRNGWSYLQNVVDGRIWARWLFVDTAVSICIFFFLLFEAMNWNQNQIKDVRPLLAFLPSFIQSVHCVINNLGIDFQSQKEQLTIVFQDLYELGVVQISLHKSKELKCKKCIVKNLIKYLLMLYVGKALIQLSSLV